MAALYINKNNDVYSSPLNNFRIINNNSTSSYIFNPTMTVPAVTTSSYIIEGNSTIIEYIRKYSVELDQNNSTYLNYYRADPVNVTATIEYDRLNPVETNYTTIFQGTQDIDYFNKIYSNNYTWYPSNEERIKSKLKSNLIIFVKSRVEPFYAQTPEERIALETLRETVSETEFRKYLKYGFVLVKGKSGDTYQIFKNRSHTKVWRNGKVIEEVCVRLDKEIKVPPTDNVIAFRQIIQTSEEEFKKLGNVYKMIKAA